MCRSVSQGEGTVSRGDESLSRVHRLRRRQDYLLCYRRGSKRRGSAVTLHFHPNPVGAARLGVTASRKVGNAVCRQRLKRWAREIFRRSPRRVEIGSFDVVVHFWPVAGKMTFSDLRTELERLFASFPGVSGRGGERRKTPRNRGQR